MKFSVVIPSFNTYKFIRQAIDSVIRQPVPVECIVIDGGSTDDTLDILKSYGERITWLSERDNGEPDAINKGLRMSTGDVVSWLDADDVLLPAALLHVDNYLELNSDCKWVYGKCKIINEYGGETRPYITLFKEIFQPRYSYNKLLVLDFIAQPSTFWRRELLTELGYVDDNERLVMDYEYWLRLGQRYRPGFINHYLACWRSHGESATSKDIKQDMKDALRVSRRYAGKRPVINALQYLTYLVCVGAYSVLGR